MNPIATLSNRSYYPTYSTHIACFISCRSRLITLKTFGSSNYDPAQRLEMASTVLRLSILVLCVGFTLTLPLEKEKHRAHRRNKRFLQIFNTVTRKMIDKQMNSSTPVEEQAENVLLAQGEIQETVDDLVEQGQELESFALSLEDIEEAEDEMNAVQVGFWKKLRDALKHLANQTFKFANLVLKTSKEISEALLDGIKSVEEIFKISLDDIKEAAEEVSLGIRKAEFAVDHVGSFLANPNRENCIGMVSMERQAILFFKVDYAQGQH
ncbi:hypothetical protein PoB_004274500 [Plakobranchus ocellatus]|uniref:Uncharacterized protein n=1 Tax=Plakobranchus ocellatus TaxID=259542 RepID=A0AAV4B6M2_9GAST|nr:hypothetical protein PoB_004274500 [Plakobranchus ocellatus]